MFQVPPEAMNPQSQTTVQDMSSNGQETEDASAEADQTNCTYRTEIVGNVVVKKKIGDHKVIFNLIQYVLSLLCAFRLWFILYLTKLKFAQELYSILARLSLMSQKSS